MVFKYIITAERLFAANSQRFHELAIHRIHNDGGDALDETERRLMKEEDDIHSCFSQKRHLLYMQVDGDRLFAIKDMHLRIANDIVCDMVRYTYPNA